MTPATASDRKVAVDSRKRAAARRGSGAPRRSRIPGRCSGIAVRLFVDRHGVAATEFAIVAPVLILLSLGGFDLTRGLLLGQKLENVAYTVADLSARDQTVTREDLGTISEIGGAILAPFSTDELRLRISSIKLNGPDKEPTLEWWFSRTEGRPTAADLREFKGGSGSGVFIRVEAWALYRPVGALAFDAAIPLDAETMARARIGERVKCSDCPV